MRHLDDPRRRLEAWSDDLVVVTLYNESASLDELYRRTVASLEALGEPFEIVFVDDGSTDGSFAELERLHAADRRVRAVRFRRNFGQHPAMRRPRARTRRRHRDDGRRSPDAPEDIPKLVAAIEGADVASGRQVARRRPWGRTLPSRLINAMLRRFTGAAVSDFGCAFNAYRRGVGADARYDRQAEVHESARALRRRQRRRGRRSARAEAGPSATRRCG